MPTSYDRRGVRDRTCVATSSCLRVPRRRWRVSRGRAGIVAARRRLRRGGAAEAAGHANDAARPELLLARTLERAGIVGAELQRFEEVKALMRKTMPVARRTLGEDNILTLMMRWACARVLYEDPAATLDDISEAVTSLEELERTARRVLGRTYPDVVGIGESLRFARAALRARETPPGSA